MLSYRSWVREWQRCVNELRRKHIVPPPPQLKARLHTGFFLMGILIDILTNDERSGGLWYESKLLIEKKKKTLEDKTCLPLPGKGRWREACLTKVTPTFSPSSCHPCFYQLSNPSTLPRQWVHVTKWTNILSYLTLAVTRKDIKIFEGMRMKPEEGVPRCCLISFENPEQVRGSRFIKIHYL